MVPPSVVKFPVVPCSVVESDDDSDVAPDDSDTETAAVDAVEFVTPSAVVPKLDVGTGPSFAPLVVGGPSFVVPLVPDEPWPAKVAPALESLGGQAHANPAQHDSKTQSGRRFCPALMGLPPAPLHNKYGRQRHIAAD